MGAVKGDHQGWHGSEKPGITHPGEKQTRKGRPPSSMAATASAVCNL